MIRRSSEVFQTLNVENTVGRLRTLESKVNSSIFRVMVIGEFKRGKSTFINAILGDEILPAFATPTTAVINEIKYGKEKEAVLYFKDPLPDELPSTIPDKAIGHIQRANGHLEPLHISYDELEAYVVIADPSKDQAASVSETPYQKVELTWPLDILENGVELIDSPGLNEHKTRQGVTMNYLPNVDAIIFVMSCSALASESEMRVIDHDIHGNGHEDVFFICNRFDQIKPKERDRLKSFAFAKLADKTKGGRDRIFFLSAALALDGRMLKKEDMLEESGIEPFERVLRDFLLNEKGKIKILQPSRDLIGRLGEGKTAIRDQYEALEQDLDVLNEKYEKAQPKLREAERAAEHILREINYHRDEIRRTAKEKAVEKLHEISGKIQGWAEESETDSSMKVFTLDHKGQAEKVVGEVVDHIQIKVEDELNVWKKEVLEPTISEGLERMQSNMEGKVDALYGQLDRLRADFSGRAVDNQEISASTTPSMVGLKGIGRFLAIQIGVTMTIGMLGILNPITFVAGIFGGKYLDKWLGTGRMEKKLKSDVGTEYASKFREGLYFNADNFGDAAYKETEEFEQAASQFLDEEISGVRNEFNEIMKEKSQGEESVRQRKHLLKQCEEEIHRVEEELNDFVFSIK